MEINYSYGNPFPEWKSISREFFLSSQARGGPSIRREIHFQNPKTTGI
jgi:hypothetical protein